MKLSFLIGTVIVIIGCLSGILWNDWNVTLKITGYVVVASFFICGILNGSFISGDRYRANYLSERKEDKDRTIKIINYLLFLAIPNIIICIIILVFKYFK